MLAYLHSDVTSGGSFLKSNGVQPSMRRLSPPMPSPDQSMPFGLMVTSMSASACESQCDLPTDRQQLLRLRLFHKLKRRNRNNMQPNPRRNIGHAVLCRWRGLLPTSPQQQKGSLLDCPKWLGFNPELRNLPMVANQWLRKGIPST